MQVQSGVEPPCSETQCDIIYMLRAWFYCNNSHSFHPSPQDSTQRAISSLRVCIKSSSIFPALIFRVLKVHIFSCENPIPTGSGLMVTSARLQYSLFLDKIVTNDLLYDLIFNACSATSLVRLLRTCQALRLSVKDYISRAFNINILLARYFTDPMEFCRLQPCTGTLISGSTALQFFDRSYYPGSDLDLYVPLAWRKSVGRYLLDQGYMFVPNRTPKSIFASAVKEKRLLTNKGVYGNFKGITAVFTFRKHSTHGEELQVQVIVAVRSPMEVILRFHSSMSDIPTLCDH